MLTVTVFTGCLQFLVFTGFGVHSGAALITCVAGEVVVGKPASITCNFRTNVTATKRSINVARYPSDGPKGTIGSDVLLCNWQHGKYDCIVEPGYTFDHVITRHLTVQVPETSERFAGMYMCFFVPENGTDAHPCELSIQETTLNDTTPVPQGGEGEKQSLLPIILPCVLVIVAMTSLGTVCLLKRRSRRCRCTTESETCESTQAMIPLDEQKVEPYLKDFKLSHPKLKEIMKLLDKEMSKGLKGEAGTAADVKMYPTFVGPLPQQSDKEEFLVLELNHPRVELALVRLQDDNASVIESENYTPPTGVQLDTLERLSGFIANCILKFTEKIKPAGKEWLLALIFPFPCKHEGPDRACLVKWTKEVTCNDVEGKELHGLIRGTLDKSMHNRKKKKAKFKMVAVINDIVSTLASTAYTNPACKIGLIVDGGLNACYLENLTHVETKGSADENAFETIINTELGALGENGCLDFCRTDYDKVLDKCSSSPGSQILEKMVSGMYLGENVRLVLEGLTRKNLMFRSVPLVCALFHKGSFNTDYVIGINSDNDEPHQTTKKILDHLAVKDYTDEDVKNVRHVCSIISERAAFLTAASLATLINHVNLPAVTVVVDGYMYGSYPRFHEMVSKKTLELVKPKLTFDFVGPQCKRSMGAARIAAAALRSDNSRTGTSGVTHDPGSSHTEHQKHQSLLS